MTAPSPVTVIGLGLPVSGAAGPPLFLIPSWARAAVESADVLVGGRAQLACTGREAPHMLPIGADTESVLRDIREHHEQGRSVAVLCSGDALFHGFGALLAKHFPPEHLVFLPGLSTFQAACSLLRLPLDSVRPVSLHGSKDFLPLAHALALGGPLFVLTDARSTPDRTAAFLAERGAEQAVLHELECLHFDPACGTAEAKHIRRMTVAEALEWRGPASAPRVLLLEAPLTERVFGLNDEDLDCSGRLYTKAPVRAAALAALGPAPRHTVWDLGAGSGAVAVEAAFLAHQGRVVAVEKEADRAVHIAENRKRFSAWNLEVLHAETPACLPGLNCRMLPSTSSLLEERPHRIFIGGGLGTGGREGAETLARAYGHLLPGGRVTVACVLLSTLETARNGLADLGAEVSVSCIQVSQGKTLAGDMRLQAENPVFIITGIKPDGPEAEPAPQVLKRAEKAR